MERQLGVDTGADRPIGHAVAIVSGGLDSTTLAYWLAERSARLTLISVNYGQRHSKELAFAARTGAVLGAEHHVVDLTSVTALLNGSALTDAQVAVPDGHYTDQTMAATVVPNRNALLLDLGTAAATAAGADTVAFGAHGGDHAIYPDCRPQFLTAYGQMAKVAGEGFLADDFQVIAPFMSITKADIVTLGSLLGVPFADTWSCYRGQDLHCGTCGTCVERREAFELAKVADPTRYQNDEAVEE
ncbi:7-cyano-7-deazaguanine synthase QueC [Kineosporia rhizophila]|uniref:7-cyano-7-deazaguanine synthase QueC n=1 Tax=Kineosporia rhizophila TaxID=84633 RepID=UPI0038CC1453